MFVPHVADQDCCLVHRQGLLQTHRAPFTAALERLDTRAKIDNHVCGAYRMQFERHSPLPLNASTRERRLTIMSAARTGCSSSARRRNRNQREGFMRDMLSRSSVENPFHSQT